MRNIIIINFFNELKNNYSFKLGIFYKKFYIKEYIFNILVKKYKINIKDRLSLNDNFSLISIRTTIGEDKNKYIEIFKGHLDLYL